MKKVTSIVLGILLVFSFTGFTGATEKATPEELVAKIKEAVKLLEEKGDAAYDIVRDKSGPYVWKDAYLFVGDLDGKMVVHPMNKALEGRNMMGAKDVTGKLFHAAMVKKVKDSPKGIWVDYHWVKPGQKKASPKVSFAVLVPGTNLFVGGGLYDIKIDDVNHLK